MTATDALRHLTERRLVDPRAALEGRLSFSEHDYRRGLLVLRIEDAPGFFLKFPSPTAGPAALAVEARVYGETTTGGVFEELAAVLPRYHSFEPESHMLVLDLLDSALPGDHPALQSDSMAAPIAARLAGALATCHARGGEDDVAVRGMFQHMYPWTLHILRPAPRVFRDFSQLELTLLRLVHAEPDVRDRLQSLRADWRWSAFTHGDLRWANVLITADDSNVSDLRIVDWEGAGIGDPAWDVAAVLSAYVSGMLHTLPLGDVDRPADAIELFAAAMPETRRRIQLFWNAYVDAGGIRGETRDAFLDRVVCYTGARLVQFAFEWARVRVQLPRFVLCSLQIALNIVRDERAARTLLVAA